MSPQRPLPAYWLMLLPQRATWLHRTSTSPSTGSGLGASSSIAIFLGATIWIALIGNLTVLLPNRKCAILITASTRFSNGFSDSNVDPEYCNLVAS